MFISTLGTPRMEELATVSLRWYLFWLDVALLHRFSDTSLVFPASIYLISTLTGVGKWNVVAEFFFNMFFVLFFVCGCFCVCVFVFVCVCVCFCVCFCVCVCVFVCVCVCFCFCVCVFLLLCMILVNQLYIVLQIVFQRTISTPSTCPRMRTLTTPRSTFLAFQDLWVTCFAKKVKVTQCEQWHKPIM